MSELINIGIIGAGKFSHQHVKALGEVDHFNLIAACRTNRKELAIYCERYEIKGYSYFEDLLRDATIDAVLISTPHHLHTSMAVAAARAGKHILLEKPFAPTLEESRQINHEAKAAGVLLMLGHTSQFSTAFQKTKSMLQNEEFGPLVQAIGFSNTLWMGPDRKEWHLKRDFGGGYLLTLGVHQVDAMLSLVNSPVRSVRCSMGTGFHSDETDDYATIFLNFSNGVAATIFCTGYRQGVLKVECEFYCQDGTIKMNSREGVFYANENQWSMVPNSTSSNWLQEALVNEWKEFAQAILDKRQPSVNGDHAIRTMAVIDAAFRSSEKQCEIWL